MDKAWVQTMFEKMGQIGKVDPGYNRLAYSEADWQAKELIMDTMKKMGLAVRMDAVGNIIGRLEGSDSKAPVVAAGSHVDTVPEGGNFDGSVGVIGALCAVKRLQMRWSLKNPVEVWVFAGHESSRFGFAHLGSRSICGIADPAKWATMKDPMGNTVPQVLASRGLHFDKIAEVKRNPEELKAFIELHIEQGPILENGKIAIGIVTDISAPIRLSIKVNGTPAHSGTTPMNVRHDALVTAANIVAAVREHAAAAASEGVVGTVGMLKASPNAMNVVPGFAEMWIDVRGINYESVTKVIEQIKTSAARYAEEEGTTLEIDVISSAKAVHLDDNLMRMVANACEKLEISYTRMIGGGGHDSQNITQIVPTSVMHIPCRNGASHTPEEYAKIEDIMAGVDVLTEVMAQLANGNDDGKEGEKQ
ncbi:MAG TPA: Zn-dependent hydrolase [Negativicutes bacterium]|nr:Zn-dependent hydrolase [Negativicutes bacterium]